MIHWGEKKRNADPGYFARLTTRNATRPVWIISDARRTTDLQYFVPNFKTITVRVESSEEVRRGRGWVWTDGVDNAESECGLDNSEWDLVISNQGDAALDAQVDKLLGMINAA